MLNLTMTYFSTRLLANGTIKKPNNGPHVMCKFFTVIGHAILKYTKEFPYCNCYQIRVRECLAICNLDYELCLVESPLLMKVLFFFLTCENFRFKMNNLLLCSSKYRFRLQLGEGALLL